MTGLRFIQNQRKKNCKCKHVAMISADWTDEDLALARQLGCKIFTKPLFFDELDKWLDSGEYGIDPKRELRVGFGNAVPCHSAEAWELWKDVWTNCATAFSWQKNQHPSSAASSGHSDPW